MSIKKLIDDKNISINELSKKTGINERTLKSYCYGERDYKKMSLENAYAIICALNCTIEDLME